MKLCVSHAEYHYDSEKAHGFKDINFTLENAGIMTILGPNACGKTTLLKCIDGLLKLDQGSILINDKDMCLLSRVEIAKAIGFVPQFHEASFAFSVLDAVLVGQITSHWVAGLTKKRGYSDCETGHRNFGHIILNQHTLHSD